MKQNLGVLSESSCRSAAFSGLVSAARSISVAIAFCLQLVMSPAHAADKKVEFNISYFALTEGRLAFTYTENSQSDIYVIDFKTLSSKPLVKHQSTDEYPSWSPDGQQLAFYSDRTFDREIYVIGADGKDLKQLTNSKGVDEDPDWSPDGKHIVFHSSRSGRGSDLHVMRADGSNVAKLPTKKTKRSGINSVPKWSPRGTEIIYSTNEHWPGWDIGIFSLENSRQTILTSGYQSFCRGSWHPSGGSFAFSYGAGNKIDIWNFEKGPKEMKVLFERPGRDYDAEWTDDGERLFFVGELNPGKGNFQLFVWEKKENRIHQVTNAPGAIRHPTWTPLPSLESIEQDLKKEAKNP